MNVYLFDDELRHNWFPFTLTMPLAHLLTGAFTIQQRWENICKQTSTCVSEPYLMTESLQGNEEGLWINTRALPNESWLNVLMNLNIHEQIINEHNELIAYAGKPVLNELNQINQQKTHVAKSIVCTVQTLQTCWDLLRYNESMILFDEHWIKQNWPLKQIPTYVKCLQPQRVYIHDSAQIEQVYLNTTNSTMIIGANVTVQDGAHIRGTCSIGQNSVVKMGAKLYGTISTGSNCLLNGEIKNTIIQSNSNKAHDGYLGDSIIGQWCNFGAGTTNSNLKNNAQTVKVWNEQQAAFLPVGNKCGVIMGHYTRTAIQSAINTGSYYGICCNVFGQGLLPKFLPHFSWGVNNTYHLDKALHDIDAWMQFKNQSLSAHEKQVIEHVYNMFIH